MRRQSFDVPAARAPLAPAAGSVLRDAVHLVGGSIVFAAVMVGAMWAVVILEAALS